MTFMDAYDQRARSTLARKMPGVDRDDLDRWLAVEPRDWVLRHGPALYAAGLSAEDAADLYRRLGTEVADSLAQLIDAGRMAAIDIRYVHLWAASGLLRPSDGTDASRRSRRSRAALFTRWVTEARRYINACDGDQHLAALSAAAGLALEEVPVLLASGELDPDRLAGLAALRDHSGGV